MNERDLLKLLIEDNVLGKGKANFEVNVGLKTPNRIDMVYETNDKIWLIEAKRNLDYKALGQIFFYKELYLYKFTPSKPISLGVACLNVSKDEIIDFYEKQGIRVFILTKVEAEKVEVEEKGGENPICGVCGKSMTKNENNEWTCKLCEYFFGISSKPVKCKKCGQIYGTFPAVENRVLRRKAKNFAKKYWIEYVCPKCRRELSYLHKYGSLADLIKEEIEERWLTKGDLIWGISGGIPEEFFEFCMGRKEINL